MNLVVTCTNRKMTRPLADLRLRELEHTDVTERARSWSERLQRVNGVGIRALDLYAGDYWSAVRKINDEVDCNLWVCSAGLGLIRASEKVAPYGATFSRGARDSISTSRSFERAMQDNRQWWQHLCDSTKRSFEAVAGAHPDRPLLLVLSPAYLRAVEADLIAARARLSDPSLLAILCPGSNKRHPLAGHLLPCSARLQGRVGGSRGSLSIRVAHLILLELLSNDIGTVNWKKVASDLEQICEESPKMISYDRAPVSDAEVARFIRSKLGERRPSFSALLRQFRDAGNACEYSRFKKLYLQQTEASHEAR